MSIRVVTDSSSDIPTEVTRDLGITVIPLYIQFGTESYRDRVDITDEEFYRRLVEGQVYPTSSVAPIGEVSEVFRNLAKEADGILSLHLSSKLSKAYEVALQAKEIVEKEERCKIAVIDSQKLGMGLGFLVILAGKLAKESKDLEELVIKVKEAVSHIQLLAILETLEYVLKGGRAAKVAGLLAGIIGGPLKLRVALTLKDGEVSKAGIIRAFKKRRRFLEFVSSFSCLREVAVEYTTDKEKAEELLKEIKSLFPDLTLYLSRITPVLGVHFGPGALLVALREES